MTRRTAPVLATLALVGLGVLAAPAAHASTIYPPSDACRVSPGTASAGSTLVFSCAEGTFGADEPVKITITGEHGSGATFGFVRFAVSTGAFDTVSGPAGELADTRITLASDATGVYNSAAVSGSSAGGTASATVATSGGTGLPSTGGDGQSLALWAGGATILVAGGALAVAATVRRRRAD